MASLCWTVHWVFLESESRSPKVRTGGLWTQAPLPSSAPSVSPPTSPSFPSSIGGPQSFPLPLPLHSPLLFMHPTFPSEAVCWPVLVLPRALPFSAHFFSYIRSDLRALCHTPIGPIKVLNLPAAARSPVSVPNQALPQACHTGPSPNAKGTLGLSTCPSESIIP